MPALLPTAHSKRYAKGGEKTNPREQKDYGCRMA